jgi:anti-sigma regulatory factor (Ser/Thr protein kinase)
VTQFRLSLDHAPESVPTARRGVVAFLEREWPEHAADPAVADLVGDAALVVSELVGNAVRHGLPPVDLDVIAVATDGHRSVRIACRDGGPWDGTPPGPDSGRGFVIVRQLAADVTIAADHESTTVAATLERG